eukprot:19663-Hanusia_phi.AAC.1
MSTPQDGANDLTALITSIRQRRGWYLQPISVHEEEGKEEERGRPSAMELEDESGHSMSWSEHSAHCSSCCEFTPSTVNSAQGHSAQEPYLHLDAPDGADAACSGRMVKRRKTECNAGAAHASPDERLGTMRESWRSEEMAMCAQLKSAGEDAMENLTTPA